MTTVLLCNKRIYTDSRNYQGTDEYHALNKVTVLADPVGLVSEDHDVDDFVVGYVHAGANHCAAGFLKMMLYMNKARPFQQLDIDLALMFYDNAARAGLHVDDTRFEIILLGNKANYSFHFEPKTPIFRIFPHDGIVGMGTGGKHAMQAVHEGYDPVRAMYHALYRDRFSGGMIDVWELTPDGYACGIPSLTRIGIAKPHKGAELGMVLSDPNAYYPLDMVINTDREFQSSMRRLDREIGEIDEEIDLVHRLRSQVKPIPSTKIQRAPRTQIGLDIPVKVGGKSKNVGKQPTPPTTRKKR